MQLKPKQLLRQQAIMAFLGLYRHKCDGIWGPEAIASKRRWENEASFIPAFPNRGLPFGDRDTVPKGMRFDRAERLFTFKDLNDEELRKVMHVKEETVNEQPKEELIIQAPAADNVEPLPAASNLEEPVVEPNLKKLSLNNEHLQNRKKKHRPS
jgi:hypothetical protein